MERGARFAIIVISSSNGFCRHPHVVRFFGAGTLPDRHNAPFLVLELVSKGALRQYLQEQPNLTWDVKKSFAADISNAMAFMHELGQMHR